MAALEVTPREAFIGLCLKIASADAVISETEVDALQVMLVKNGFTSEEIRQTFQDLSQLTPNEAIDWGARAIWAVREMQPSMQRSLVDALTQISAADGANELQERSFLAFIKAAVAR